MKSQLFSLVQTADIAISNLRSCYSRFGILAGRHHFTDYWARDGFFAAFRLGGGDVSVGGQRIGVFSRQLDAKFFDDPVKKCFGSFIFWT